MHTLASLQSSLAPPSDSFTPHPTWANSAPSNNPHPFSAYPSANHMHHFNDVTKNSLHYNPHLSAGEIVA
ncbi:hypothetical protein DPMN_161512 [Dreissena polymorpha]|uniref:Uncharacterized protein n=1 Tax=Dreissena polymorpha TaxID=45954 RepID=A0A9D4ET64_DREPO|nr:hypothetical protein DPMN_161512 [Dreissena polymorpha]